MDASKTIWIRHGGRAPSDRPICGYRGDQCPPTFRQKYLPYIIVAVCCFLTIISAAVAVVFYTVRYIILSYFRRIRYKK